MAKILVIDDLEEMRDTIKEILEREGHTVTLAPNGELGEELFRQDPVGLIITDVLMPGQDGVSTMTRIRKDYPDVRVIAYSGGGPEASIKAATTVVKAMGADVTLRKPFKREKLIAAVNKLVKVERTGR
jgi:CheY-like chemotaxis protein